MNSSRQARLAILLGAVFLLLHARAATGRDNILLIVADDVGVDKVGCYAEGPDPPPTPNIDALAKSGILFRNAWSNPVCSPTRATINTGRYSFRTGVGLFIMPGQRRAILKLSEITLPELLNRSHYRTGLIGKWHLGSLANGGRFGPNLQGWRHFAGTLNNLFTPFDYDQWPKVVNARPSLSRNYITTDNVDEALRFINGQRRPWFCCLCFTAAHLPFAAPPPNLHTVDLDGLDPETDPILFYRAIVQAMDTELGRLFGGMGSELQETNVIFIGDNGTVASASDAPFLPEHAKGTLYEGGVNVPMIVTGPIVRGPCREELALVHTVDLFATILEMAGVDPRRRIPRRVKIDSISLVPYLTNPAQTPLRKTVFSEIFIGENPNAGAAAIRNHRFKLIRGPRVADVFAAIAELADIDSIGDLIEAFQQIRPNLRRGVFSEEEFYDLERDPFETINLLDTPLTAHQRRNYESLRNELATIRGTRRLPTPPLFALPRPKQ